MPANNEDSILSRVNSLADFLRGSNAKSRPVLMLAPDAVVFINKDATAPLCTKCGSRTSISGWINSIATNGSVDSGSPGTASFTLTTPRSSAVKDFGIRLMQEVDIYIKGRFLDANNQPVYYRAFWGFITGLSKGYSDGANTINVECSDILKWWAMTEVEIRPSAVSTGFSGVNSIAFASRYNNLLPHEVIINLAHAAVSGLSSIHKALFQIQDNSYLMEQSDFKINSEDTLGYWSKRFGDLEYNIRIFGITPEEASQAAENAIKLDLVNDPLSDGNSRALNAYQNLISPPLDNNLFKNVYPFYSTQGGEVDLYQSSQDTILNVANSVKDVIGWEFFMDVSGEIVFKPPFYNLDVRSNLISNIYDTDIISWNISENLDNIYSRVDVTGSMYVGSSSTDGFVPYNYYIDWSLAKKFGIRSHECTKSYLLNDLMCLLYGVQELSLINSKRFSGTIEIAGRPELRMGYPIYVPSLDTFYYITGISHNFSFGSTFTTQLTVTAARSKYKGQKLPPGTANAVLRMDPSLIPPTRTGVVNPTTPTTTTSATSTGTLADTALPRNLGSSFEPLYQSIYDSIKGQTGVSKPSSKIGGDLRSIVSAYLRRVYSETYKEVLGSSANNQDSAQQAADKRVLDILSKANVSLRKENQISGIDASIKGLINPNQTGPVNFVLNVGRGNLFNEEVSSSPVLFTETSKGLIPISDESGYELIGGFPYGRGYRLDGGVWKDKIKTNERLSPTTLINSDPNRGLTDKLPVKIQDKEAVNRSQTESSQASAADYVLNVSPDNIGKSIANMSPTPNDSFNNNCKCEGG